MNPTNKAKRQAPVIKPLEREPVYVGVKQIASALDMPFNRVRQWIATGALPAKKVGVYYVATQSSLQEFINSMGGKQ